MLPQGDFTAAVFVSLAAGAVAAVLMWRSPRGFADAAAADRPSLVFCLFPGTIVFAWPYADALLVAFMCGTISLLLDKPLAGRGRCRGAGDRDAVPAGWHCSSRACWLRTREVHGDRARRLRAAASVAVISASGFLLFLAYLWACTGNAMQWFDVERDLFGEGTPWKRLPTTIADIFRDGAEYGRILVVAFVVIAIVLLVVQLTSQQPLWATSITVIAMYFALDREHRLRCRHACSSRRCRPSPRSACACAISHCSCGASGARRSQ